jgi:Uma2 family endonuclease
MASQSHVLTPDDMLDMPLPNGIKGYEFVDGQPVPLGMSSLIHGRLIVEVARRLANHVIEHNLPGEVLGDASFVLSLDRDPQRMRRPDIVYVSQALLDVNPDQERIARGVPDFAIEIDLRSGRKPGGLQRVFDYLDAGARLVWSIDPHSQEAMAYWPDRSARIYGLGDVMDASEVVPGFKLPLAELFK